ncbi:hypothetical protein RN001_008148 [Aquatica leii]|uniref:Uncharacterized protein n=1 Tax=Aquatica leii TaxID=1421715 RepID=A0AAN7P9B6_9COLE|nr:hypothetical protein RN001_008148 [Aquatica leii]
MNVLIIFINLVTISHAVVSHHWEERNDNYVRGGYSFLDSDGRVRVVQYHVNGNKGFRAVVTFRQPWNNGQDGSDKETGSECICHFKQFYYIILYKNSDYSFSYGVKDMQTGDVKDQWESKQGGVVKGHYSVMEADGMLRTVEYVADKEHGFNAVVKYNTNSHHPLSSSHQQVQMETDQPQVHETIIENKFSESNLKPTVFNHYNLKSAPPKPKPIKENQPSQTLNFPIDLSFLESNSKIIPLTISKITPVEIKVDELNEGLQKSSDNNNRFSQPFLEKDFKPILSQIHALSAMKYEKKPLTTPGLRNYATKPLPNLQTVLQQENHDISGHFKQFPEKKPLQNMHIVKLRPPMLKRPPTVIAVKYH